MWKSLIRSIFHFHFFENRSGNNTHALFLPKPISSRLSNVVCSAMLTWNRGYISATAILTCWSTTRLCSWQSFIPWTLADYKRPKTSRSHSRENPELKAEYINRICSFGVNSKVHCLALISDPSIGPWHSIIHHNVTINLSLRSDFLSFFYPSLILIVISRRISKQQTLQLYAECYN